MNQLKGPFLVIWKDLKLQAYIFSLVTLLLVIIYSIVGIYFQPDDFNTFMSGPIYGILLFMPFFMFLDPFKSSMGLGATRMNYISSLIGNYALFILVLMIVHNVLYQMSEWITGNTVSTAHIVHVADIVSGDGALTYFWVDILIGIIFVGIGTLVAAFLYRFGYILTLATTLVLGIIIFLWMTLGDAVAIFNWLFVHVYSVLHVFALLGVVCLLLTYPIMKNVTLKE